MTLGQIANPGLPQRQFGIISSHAMAVTPTMSDYSSGTRRSASRLVLFGLAAGAGVVATATAALWAHYGTAVFYEMILAGINACF